MNNFLSSSEIENTVEHHLARFQKKNNKLYLILICLIFTSILLLFVLRVDVSVQANALIRPHLEKIELNIQQAGYVEESFLENGKNVKAGEPLIRLSSEKRNEEEINLNRKEKELSNRYQDLLTLTKNIFSINKAVFKSQSYLANYASAKSELQNLNKRIDFQNKQAERNKISFEQGLIAKTEMLLSQEKIEELKDKKESFIKRKKQNWEDEKVQIKERLDDLKLKQRQLKLDQKNKLLLAPFSGSLEQVLPLTKGQFVNAGKVAVLSPDSGFVLEAYVLPKDIGFIHVGMPVRVQLDAFNYNQWGFVNARVESISDDFVQMDKQVLFKVKSSLKEKKLQLKNGFIGKIRKGMTARARFIITNRKLSDLLFDKVSDWLDPANDGKK